MNDRTGFFLAMQLIVCSPMHDLCHCIVVVSVNESVSTEGFSQDTLLHN